MTQDAASRAAKLTKTVPAHKVTATFTWVRKDWMEMTGRFRDIRAKHHETRDSHKCWWCKTKFTDGDKMALACQKGKGNILLCDGCATEALKAVEGESK